VGKREREREREREISKDESSFLLHLFRIAEKLPYVDLEDQNKLSHL
jgi:hypothetical protein